MALLTTIVILFSFGYSLAIFLRSRRRRAIPLPAPDGLFFVFVVPCLNEELVIGASLDRLTALPGTNFAVLVIDDGSDDRTAAIVEERGDERVWLLRRVAPHARQGKGEALNAAFRHLRTSGVLGDRSARDVIIGVVDADGRVAANVLFEVAPYFRDPRAGAVQIGVRMYNVGEGLLPRMQDLEFVTFTELFQRARQRMGSVGLGGNGQFARLSALETLGDAPWTDCLTEDLDLGLRLLVNGWGNNFCPTTWVSQQAVTDVRRLVRQRSRWFQGHLQCWTRVPMVLRSSLPAKTTADLVYHLLSPALVLVMTLPMVVFVISIVGAIATDPGETWRQVTAHQGLLVAVWYALAFGMAPFYAFAYWLRESEVSFLRALGYAHVYSLYSYLWVPAGWRAVWRTIFRKRGWAKTTRTVEQPG